MPTIAVTGATGAQGGATARSLLAAGHRVRALTRHPGSPAAEALRRLGADVRHADFDDRASLDAALAGADALFAVTTPFGTDTGTETRQGRALVDAAAAARLGHVVLTSAAHADRGTGVPHYESKHAVERHLRACGVPWTVIAPAAFMDNYTSGWTLDGLREGAFAWPMPAGRPLTLIPAADIGAFAALVLLRRDEFTGRRIDIASDECTPEQIAAALAEATGTAVTHQEVPLDHVRTRSADLAAMFAYFTGTGLDVDVSALRRAYPEVGWHSFTDWALAQDWAGLLGRQGPGTPG
ncbi:nucleotide-diphosphate-sugar epimerase [Streptomyces lucensis JCM 4490]|uniref:Nucleotide-diphosphate-sugar epimerase n=1 Tax=Streptomyces lucensis JCM 4490 TaxID=1306176 RepID=A0A918MT36_9ACTN|nr:NmrA/HSCARG family protein [Streptomyces lucensis]GGW65303.1 nucleotide-diphosphate-sugar epimerase [Streptomyces lucensis JCM 4490]